MLGWLAAPELEIKLPWTIVRTMVNSGCRRAARSWRPRRAPIYAGYWPLDRRRRDGDLRQAKLAFRLADESRGRGPRPSRPAAGDAPAEDRRAEMVPSSAARPLMLAAGPCRLTSPADRAR